MSTIRVKVSEANDHALAWMVAKCMPFASDVYVKHGCVIWKDSVYQPHLDWSQGGPIIDRERIDIEHDPNGKPVVMGRMWHGGRWLRMYGPIPLIAAMRCFVASKLGDEVDVPEELLP